MDYENSILEKINFMALCEVFKKPLKKTAIKEAFASTKHFFPMSF
jgi:hypothetical protein